MTRTPALVALNVLVLLPIATEPISARAEGPTRVEDLHSFGNFHQIRVKHVALDLTVDFGQKNLRGTATLTLERLPGCPAHAPLVLDTRALSITKVEAGSGSVATKTVPFELGAADKFLGASLTIRLPDEAEQVWISYETSPQASALQWLDPPQTAGGKLPFLFTQSEAIHARSWIPLQDSPSVRMTYGALIHVPAGLRAVMSAVQQPRTGAPGEFMFSMPQPIPSYLIALAVGELAFRPLGPRTGVYAEPSVIDRAAYEFADTERMVVAAEKQFGPYRWDRYDILVLPPSFPFGGMENPKLSFATPTILAGDRSLVSLVSHELAHSWSGNLVTNATWRDFWLNEGFTVYLERRIIEDIYGPDRAAMEAVLGLQELREELEHLDDKEEILHIDLAGRDPDDGMTRVPYEKGALFLTTLERAFGRERVDAFLRSYFDHFAFQSITTADFEQYLQEHLFSLDARAAGNINLHAWLYEPGLPAGFPEPHSERFDSVLHQARQWLEGKVAAENIAATAWSTQEWLHFLRAMPETLTADQMAKLDAAFHLTDHGNSEIVQQWLLLAIRAHYATADARLETFLCSIGRRKYLIPLYTELIKTPEGKARAHSTYTKARPLYHPITVESVDRLLGPT